MVNSKSSTSLCRFSRRPLTLSSSFQDLVLHLPISVAQSRRADAGDDVFALGVDQELAEEDVLAGGGLRVKATPVAESSPMFPKTMAWTFTAVPRSPRTSWISRYLTGAVAHPALEDGLDRRLDLFHRALGEVGADVLAVDALVAGDDFLEALGFQVGVELHHLVALDGGELVLELLVVHAHDGVAEHVDQAAIGVVGEAARCR